MKIYDIVLKTTYQNINTANVGKVVVFYKVIAILFGKKYGSISLKLCGGKKSSKFVFSYFKTKKIEKKILNWFPRLRKNVILNWFPRLRKKVILFGKTLR